MYQKLTAAFLALSFSIACQAAESAAPASAASAPGASAEAQGAPATSEGKADKARVEPHRPTSIHAPKPQQ